jgi:hypothetical protein
MARPVLVAKKSGSNTAGTTTINVPLNSGWNTTYGSATYTPADNDFIIVSYSAGSAAVNLDLNATPPSGTYTERADLYQDDTSDSNFYVGTKVAVASTDTSLTLSAGTAATQERTWIVEIWSGVDTATPMDVTVTTAGGINGGRPNPPSITPTTADTVVIATCSAAVLTGMVAFAQSGSELANFLSIAVTGGEESVAGSGSFAWTSGAFDPVAWVGSSTGTGACWNAVCLALRPSVPGGGGGAITRSFGMIIG